MFGGGFVGPTVGAVGEVAGIGLTVGALGIIGNEVNQIIPNAKKKLEKQRG